jgi:transposase-like protein
MTQAGASTPNGVAIEVLEQACQQSRNVARTCRHFRISRQAYYRWKRRYEAHGSQLRQRWAVVLEIGTIWRFYIRNR